MKFLFATDLHGRSNNPKARLDEFPKTVLNKLEWLMEQSRIHDAPVLFGGDFLNRPDTSPAFIGQMAAIFKTAHGGRVYGVLGNHDIYGQNIATYDRTPLSIVSSLGVVQILHKPQLFYKDGERVMVSGTSFFPDIDKKDKRGYLCENYEEYSNVWPDMHIHIVHGFLTKAPWPQVEHTLISEIANTNADIVLSGHEHSGFGIVQENNKWFCNPGALCRVSAAIGDVNMEVKVALIDTKNRDCPISLLPLPSYIARPASEVLDRKQLEEEKRQQEKAEQFAQSLSAADQDLFANAANVYEALAAFAMQNEIPNDVEALARGFLQDAEQLLANKNLKL